MSLFKRIIKSIVYPILPIFLILVPASILLLLYPVICAEEIYAVTVIGYVTSAYTLMIICFRLPRIISDIQDFKHNNKFMRLYTEDTHFKIQISLYGTFILNAVYAVFQLCLGMYHSSVWYYSLALYYVLIALVRFLLLRHTRSYSPCEDMQKELRRYRLTGMFLLMINIALSAILINMILRGVMIVHHEITTIAMAAYTFTSVTMSIVNIIKYRKYHSPIFSGAKAVSLAAALVSVLTLENAMLTAFGSSANADFNRLMMSITGACIEIFILTLSIYMIVRSTKEIKFNGK